MFRTIALIGALAALGWANQLPAADEQPEGPVTIAVQNFGGGGAATVTVQAAVEAPAAPGAEGMRLFTGGPIQFAPKEKSGSAHSPSPSRPLCEHSWDWLRRKACSWKRSCRRVPRRRRA